MTDTETLYCVNHPNRETLLRCNQCEQPICVSCAVQTPTGYRCQSCVRGQQKKFNTAQASDFFLAAIIAAVLSFIGSYLVSLLLGFLTLFAAPFAGMLIERVVRAVIKNRRSNTLFLTIAAAAAVGSLPLLAIRLLSFFSMAGAGAFNLYSLLPIVWQAAYSILVTGAVYYRLRGISF